MYRPIYIAIIIFLFISSTYPSYPYSSGLCRKCIDRDFTLYTVGHEFSSGDKILFRLLNIGDRDVYLEYIDLYISYYDDELIYIGRLEIDSLIKSGSYYEFSVDAPYVDWEVTAYLIVELSSGDRVISNDITLKPSNSLKLFIEYIDILLTLLSIFLIGFYISRFYIKT